MQATQTKLFVVRNKSKIANKFKNKLNYKCTNSRVLSEMQIFRANKSRQPWSVEEKQFAISILYNGKVNLADAFGGSKFKIPNT